MLKPQIFNILKFITNLICLQAFNNVSETLDSIEAVLYGSTDQDEILTLHKEILSTDILLKLLYVLPQLNHQVKNVIPLPSNYLLFF